jgi:hypothetical protein
MSDKREPDIFDLINIQPCEGVTMEFIEEKIDVIREMPEAPPPSVLAIVNPKPEAPEAMHSLDDVFDPDPAPDLEAMLLDAPPAIRSLLRSAHEMMDAIKTPKMFVTRPLEIEHETHVFTWNDDTRSAASAKIIDHMVTTEGWRIDHHTRVGPHRTVCVFSRIVRPPADSAPGPGAPLPTPEK